MGHSGAHTRHFVGHDGHTDARAADQDTSVKGAASQRFCHLRSNVRILHGFVTIAPKILVLNAVLPEHVHDEAFQGQSQVIRTDRYFHLCTSQLVQLRVTLLPQYHKCSTRKTKKKQLPAAAAQRVADPNYHKHP